MTKLESRLRSSVALLAAMLALFASVPATLQGAPAPTPAVKPVPLVRKAPPPKPIDWDKITAEATDLLSHYIQINTTNPPGNELAAAKFLKEKFLADGIAANTWEPAPGRGIIAARLRGIGKHTRAILLLSHMDVVPANAKDWQVPPFSGQVKDGEIWGRGALDDKGPGVIELMAMLAIKRAGILLDRDVLFVATGDEEEGGKLGAGWFVDHEHSIYRDSGYVLNEGGGILVEPNGKKLYAVSVSEKTPLWLQLSAEGPAGHAADPPAETAVTHLVRALQGLIEFHPPIRIMTPVAGYFHAVAELNRGPKQFLDLTTSLQDPAYLRKFTSVPSQNALVRDTVTPTVLGASQKTNVIAPYAYAEVDCRLLPGTDPKAFLHQVRKVIGDNKIKIDVILNFPPASSPQKTELMSAIRTLAQREDKAPVVPTMIAGFTDSHYFREKKITSYGFVPIDITVGESHGVHGTNERVGVKELSRAIERMTELLKILGGR
jgi:acetylornithine deacetylase/succinyl-diaminopimelate desuccinylase-like protein